jgi:glycosyltransferase involved in cell wall biosynthesis
LKERRTLLLFCPSIEDGGVEKNLYNIANFISKKIGKIYIITANYDKRKKFDKKINFISPKSNRWIRSSRLLKTIISIIYLIIFFIKNNNKILLFSFNSNLYGILLAKIFNFKVIVRSNASPTGYSNNFIKRKIFTLILKLSDYIIVNSIYLKSELKKKFNIKSECIYNPLENIKAIKKKSQNKIKLSFFKKNYLKIISAGRLVKQKNHIILLKAIKILKKDIKIQALIIGNGEEKNFLSNYIKINKMQRNIKIITYSPNIYSYIKKANLFILTSLFEGLPNVLLESLALKKFIISSDCPTGPREILKNGKYGFLYENNNLKQLTKKILYFYNNNRKCKKIATLGYKSLSRFNFDNQCNLYLKIINKFL